MAKGDHIKVNLFWCYHHGIDCGDGQVIHYIGTEGQLKRGAVIAKTSMEEYSFGKPVLTVEHHDRFDPEEIVQRAHSRLGENAYNLISNNCEHFSNWQRSVRARAIS